MSVTGDLYCKISIETPVKLTGEQKELLREFSELTREGASRHHPREHSWLGSVKQFFK